MLATANLYSGEAYMFRGVLFKSATEPWTGPGRLRIRKIDGANKRSLVGPRPPVL
jgi:hypothetical protein